MIHIEGLTVLFVPSRYEQNEHVPFVVDDRLETHDRRIESWIGSACQESGTSRSWKHGPREGALFACQLGILRSEERDSTSLRGVN